MAGYSVAGYSITVQSRPKYPKAALDSAFHSLIDRDVRWMKSGSGSSASLIKINHDPIAIFVRPAGAARAICVWQASYGQTRTVATFTRVSSFSRSKEFCGTGTICAARDDTPKIRPPMCYVFGGRGGRDGQKRTRPDIHGKKRAIGNLAMVGQVCSATRFPTWPACGHVGAVDASGAASAAWEASA